jgi:ABC-2 type transport system ATP-binding protein
MWAGTLTWARPVEEALGLVDLRHRVGVPVKQLSGGEQRRLDLAMAILGRPEVLILDEPATGLDPESRLCTWRLVRDLLESGTTEVLSTHNVAEAEELGGPPRDPAPGQDRPGRHPGRGDCVLAGPGLVHAPPRTPAIQSRTCRALYGRRSSREAPPARCFVHNQDVQPTLAALLGWASSHGVELTDLNARSASPEEALLAVAESATGRTQDQEMTA